MSNNVSDPNESPTQPPVSKPNLSGWSKKLGWFIGLWAISVLALGAVAYLFRILMHAVGLSPT
ncbi:MAG: Protein of unknown function (DUF2474) [Glomeribacter sp. 1016415]|uniref:Uncharacterized protein n=1 Tax=Mycoavidus cysteinexigens TaxID=1553431 RepID=A0A2Z6EY55_9BURK|nr:DUF2474 domain-containing protein [Mycoavidus cysteinexigens]MCX8566228.1 Protein of unknown function (DUF2474) [Glomeribacter sp. 1016415]BBE10347.1 Putative uncharacterized protein [Mycoavidus cysteinexigens]GAM53280.1 hypothetical protein EBME_1743 [bacterium endosymbiont of Mortierella elongata FMR23-6]GLR00764.1 hypothetical protein GCM10007934_05750 [Mycoavidus cysteinexigens]